MDTTTPTTGITSTTSATSKGSVRRLTPWLLGATILLGAGCTPAGSSEPDESGFPAETAAVASPAEPVTEEPVVEEPVVEEPVVEEPVSTVPPTTVPPTTTAPPAHALTDVVVGECLDTSSPTPVETPCGAPEADAEVLALSTASCSGEGTSTLSFSSTTTDGVTHAFEFCLGQLAAPAQPVASPGETDGWLELSSCFTAEPLDAAAAAAGAVTYDVVITELPCTADGADVQVVVGEVAQDHYCADDQGQLAKLPEELGYGTYTHWCHVPR